MTLQKLKNHNFLFYLKVKPHVKIFFARKCFKSCHRYFVTFSVKIWSKEAQGYKSNCNRLLFSLAIYIYICMYQYAFIDVFSRKKMIDIWKINPWWTNSSINGSREQAFTENAGYFCNIGTRLRKCIMKLDYRYC